MRLTALPAPDQLDFDLPDGCVCLVAHDGTATGKELVRRLTARGWRVVQLQTPSAGTTAPIANVPLADASLPGLATLVLENWEEATLTTRLAALEREHGPVGALVHLQPTGTGDLLAPSEKADLKWLFLLAKHLQRPLTESAKRGHSLFVSVTRLDGQLGLGQDTPYTAVKGGVFGLTKTLNLEWPQVFCRAVDVSPAFTPERAVEAILAELHDPNRLIIETGWSEQGRVTLSA